MEISLVSTENGWMDGWAFTLYMIHLIPWILEFRENMGPNYTRISPLPIFDGHVSRTSPLAISLATIYAMNIFILPSHSSHCSQLFDIALASPLKRTFNCIILVLIQIMLLVEKNHSATLRKFEMDAFVQAWNMVCTATNCVSGAKEVAITQFLFNWPNNEIEIHFIASFWKIIWINNRL